MAVRLFLVSEVVSIVQQRRVCVECFTSLIFVRPLLICHTLHLYLPRKGWVGLGWPVRKRDCLTEMRNTCSKLNIMQEDRHWNSHCYSTLRRTVRWPNWLRQVTGWEHRSGGWCRHTGSVKLSPEGYEKKRNGNGRWNCGLADVKR